jgi:suppressor of tumorigenicity protein 13
MVIRLLDNIPFDLERTGKVMTNGDLDEVVNHLTKAIECNPTSAIICASRASVYVKMKKPNAAIRDAMLLSK